MGLRDRINSIVTKQVAATVDLTNDLDGDKRENIRQGKQKIAAPTAAVTKRTKDLPPATASKQGRKHSMAGAMDLTQDDVVELLDTGRKPAGPSKHPAKGASTLQVNDLTGGDLSIRPAGSSRPSCGKLPDQDADLTSELLQQMEAMHRKQQELQRQLEAAKAAPEKKHMEVNGVPLAPLPDHWHPHRPDEIKMPKYVLLPFQDEAGQAGQEEEWEDEETDFSLTEAAIQELEFNGVSRADAVAALKHCSGDLDAAVAYAVECSDRGGAAKVQQEHDGKDAHAARFKAEQDEAQKVVAEFRRAMTAHGALGQAKLRVRAVERVQHWWLWTKYQLRKTEVEHAAAASAQPVNERFLFHGTSKTTVATITNEGFDIRVSGNGALGNGTYFAENSSCSHAYCQRHYVPAATATATQTTAVGVIQNGGQAPLQQTGGHQDPFQRMLLQLNGMQAQLQQSLQQLNGVQGPLQQTLQLLNGGQGPPQQMGGQAPRMQTRGRASLKQTGGRAPRAQTRGQGPSLKKQRRATAAAAALVTPGSTATGGPAAAPPPVPAAATLPAAPTRAPLNPAPVKKPRKRVHTGIEQHQFPGQCAMLYCRVALGRTTRGTNGLRKPPPGCDSVTGGDIFAVFDNAQAYPEYIIHYDYM